LVAQDRHRVSPQLHDCELHRAPRAQRRLLEQEGGAPAGKHLARVEVLALCEDLVELVDVQVVDLEEVASHASTSVRIARASSISSSLTRSDGAKRRAVGLTGFTTK